MKKPEANVWWVPGGDSRTEQQEGYGHCQSLPPMMFQEKESIKFIPESEIEALIESKCKEQREICAKTFNPKFDAESQDNFTLSKEIYNAPSPTNT